MYKIGEFSKITGLTVKALRYYDEQEILVPSIRCENSYRIYSEQDFEKAQDTSVLESLVILKKTHYNIKMLLALIVCDLYSEYMVIPLNYRMAFETLMNAIDWPISFSEVLAKSKTE